MSKLDYTVFNSSNTVTFSKTYDFLTLDIHSQHVQCVEVDRRILGKQRICLADHHNSVDLTQHSQCEQFPDRMVTLIYMLQKCVFDCELLNEKEEVELDAKGKPKKPKKGGKPKRPKKADAFVLGMDKYYPRVDQYIQAVPDKETGAIIGWRFFYVQVDPNFNMDQALMSQFFWLTDDLDGKPISTETTDRLLVRDQRHWVESIIGTYPRPSHIEFDPSNPYEECNRPLNDSNNNASFVRVFRAKDIINESIFRDRAPSAYLSSARYVDEDKPGCIHFPGQGAIYVPHRERHPDFIHHVALLENALTRAIINRLLPKVRTYVIEQRYQKTIHERRLHSGDGDVLRQVKEANQSEIDEMEEKLNKIDAMLRDTSMTEDQLKVLEEALEAEKIEVAKKMNVWRRSGEVVERMNVLFTSPDALDPGYRANVRWLLDKMNDSMIHKNKPWSMMRTKHKTLDPTLPVFSSFIARDLFLFEDVVGIATLHQELLLLMLTRLGVFEISDQMKNHIVLLGPQSTGKSVIQNHTIKMSTPACAVPISYETAKAYATDCNHNFEIMVHDELNEKYFDDGGGNEGSSLIKTMLTEKKITVNGRDKDTGETKESVAFVDIVMLAASNRTKEHFPPALGSRFILATCARYIRDGYDMSLKDAEQQMVARDRGQYAATAEENIIIMVLFCFIEMLIFERVLPKVGMNAANLYLASVTAGLLKHGVVIEPRVRLQINNYIRICAILEGIRRCWFTTEIFKDENKPFEFVDLVEVAPFLFATEQHVFFVLTLLRDVLIDPTRDAVVKALVDLCITNPEGGKLTLYEEKRVDPGHGQPVQTVYDGNYLFISLPKANGQTDSEVYIKELQKKITQRIYQKDKVTYLPAVVQEVLRTLIGETHSFNDSFDGNGVKHEGKRLEAQFVLRVSTEPGKVGMCISYPFLQLAQHVSVDVIRTVLNNMMTEHTRPRKIITGNVFRTREKMFPYMMETMEMKPVPGKQTAVANLAFRKPGYGECVNGQPRINEHDGGIITIDRSVEEYYYEKFLDEHQLHDKRPANFPADCGGAPGPMNYPDDYIKAHIAILAASETRIHVPLKRSNSQDQPADKPSIVRTEQSSSPDISGQLQSLQIGGQPPPPLAPGEEEDGMR
jgi:hypothetical protein